ncbi:MAG: type VI secretion system protein TssA [Azoarcus sp.]|jgi:type VI secretion system protein ImpA|nr:type VI secretion system protein TssA [Azoarcus sp.]
MNSIFDSRLFETSSLPGEDLEYTAGFAEFVALSTPREERQVGDHVIPAQQPNWAEVFNAGCALLQKSRDLRILTKICLAALQKHGLPGFAQGLSLMAQWVESEWDYLYPLLEIEGDFDPLARSNAVSEISDRNTVVRALRQASLLETQIGPISISAVEHLLDGKIEEGQSNISSIGQLSTILVAEKSKNQERLSAIASISSSLAVINNAFKSRLEPEYWLDTELLTTLVNRVARYVAEQLQEQAPGAQPETQADQPNGNGADAPSASPKALPASLNSRADAFKALALAREYFEHHEPSHPAPLLIRRIERMAGAGFKDIVKDLMPDALSQLVLLMGETLAEENGEYAG